MHEISLTTPALIFSAVSLILLAYTNRFLAYTQVVRNLYSEFKQNKDNILIDQIKNLRKRLYLIRSMQILGVLSLFFSVVSMLTLYLNLQLIGALSFALSLLLMIGSLGLSIREIQISVISLELHLNDMED
ncbi:MAG: DUF2721 domain-containing protein [Bacteroidetes bacterium HGW-Bacteroidetes-4]|jgi:hypothetical protein|nr:MAG: DUF2721 domain-containing protein [Bacteroidetes bacterium HGW-Bacteroidetes-4]